VPDSLIKHSFRFSFVAQLALIALVLSSCAAPTKLVTQDTYSRTLLFTVPASSQYAFLASTFSGFPARERSIDTVIGEILSKHRLRKVRQFPIPELKVEAVVAEIRPKHELAEVIEALAKDDRVESVQNVRPYKLLSYNDPYFALQNTVTGDRIEHIHEITTGKNVVVGIVDTGVDRWHPELADNIVYTSDFVGDELSNFDFDEHGTAVAGVIGSAANNDLGIVGVAPDVKLMIFKACHQEMPSRRTSCDSVSIIQALNDVLERQPDVLNLSLAGPRDPIIERLLRRANSKGMVLVAAVHEKGPWQRSFPASMSEVIAVGTTLRVDNTGGLVLAPGTDMLTTAPGASYGFKSGSSMATAYVSGIVALMKEKVPSLTSNQIQEMLIDSARLDENELPVVDMCSAVNTAANGRYQNCQRPREMAVNVEDATSPAGTAELTN